VPVAGPHKRRKLKLGRDLAQSYQRRLGATGAARAATPASGPGDPGLDGPVTEAAEGGPDSDPAQPAGARPGNLKPSPGRPAAARCFSCAACACT
jgi:hypothetical protein